MLLAVNINFVVFSVFLDDLLGQIFTLIVLTVAAAESALGLAILIVYYRVRGGIALDTVQTLRS
jgi:NADH-quinone oxidoreductase subunit K